MNHGKGYSTWDEFGRKGRSAGVGLILVSINIF